MTIDQKLKNIKFEEFPNGDKIGEAKDRGLEEFVKKQGIRNSKAIEVFSKMWFG